MEDYKTNLIIESILTQYEKDFGSDFVIYRNHVYRIFYLAISLDSNQENGVKYAIAAAFHDLGIWTHSFDYLEPSIELAAKYLKRNNHSNWIEEISLMIDNHHKTQRYQGECAETVENFRRADWVDVVLGVKMFGIKKETFRSVKKQFPITGFHRFLVIQSVKYFFKHPLNPLPMFKK